MIALSTPFGMLALGIRLLDLPEAGLIDGRPKLKACANASDTAKTVSADNRNIQNLDGVCNCFN